MKNYINTFNTFDDIDDALSTSQLNAPYVAYAEGEDKVYMGTSFNGWTGWTGFYNIQDTSQATKIANTNPTEISVDNGDWVAYTNQSYTFETTGLHKVGFMFNTNTPSFQNCTSLTKMRIPDGVTSIGSNAFDNCSSLTGITIPDGVTSIGNRAFNNCSRLTGITIPDGVTSIQSNVFRYCSSLTEITIPDGVTSIGDTAFYQCGALTGVTSLNPVPPTLGGSSLANTNNCPIYVPASSVDAYKTASGWSDYASRIQAIQ